MIIYPLVREVFPQVKRELAKWEQEAELIPNFDLRSQALQSICNKSFHCMGGAVYALYPQASRETVIRFIVAYQTISDYLDNLVDNMGVYDEKAFAQLHLAMEDGLQPEKPLHDYYRYYPHREDHYLLKLIEVCRECLKSLPQKNLVNEEMIWQARQYSYLQTYKHLDPDVREKRLSQWIASHRSQYPLNEWELAAATGSTLGIFVLFSAACNSQLKKEEVVNIMRVYFPWINSIHILLDYLIDLQEDQETGQFNFVEYYRNTEQANRRLRYILTEVQKGVKGLNYAQFHKTVLQGLLAMYLSDPKVELSAMSIDKNALNKIEIVMVRDGLLDEGGTKTKILCWICGNLRKMRIL